MTAILAEFATFLTLPRVLAASQDFTLITILTVAIIAAASVMAAVALRH